MQGTAPPTSLRRITASAVKEKQKVRSPFYKTGAQRSGFGFGRRSDEVTELSRPRGSEGYAVRDDAESEGFIFGKHKKKSLRRPSGAAGGN